MTIPALQNLGPGVYAAVVVLVALVVGWLVSWVFQVFVHRLTSKTATELDDILVKHMRIPISLSVFLYGVWIAIRRFEPGDSTRFFADGVLLSTALLLWAFGIARGLTEFLEWLGRHQGRLSYVNRRTLPLFDIFARVIVYGGLIYFLFLAWSIDVTGWLASAGVIGIAVGFAAQETLANLIAGMFILADAPYKLGDYLMLESGQRGVVTEIGFRTTRLLTKDDVEIVVPNGMMANALIANESGGPHEKTRVNVPIGVAYGSDIDVVRGLLETVPHGLPGIALFPVPQVHFASFGVSSLDFEIRVWLENPDVRASVVDAMNTRIYKSLLHAGIEIPYSKHDVYLHTVASDNEPD